MRIPVARGELVQAAGMRRDVFLGARFAFLFVRAFVWARRG
jgi:hypothetical protein